MKYRWQQQLAIGWLLTSLLLPTAKANLNTATIVASSFSPSCIRWRINGICYWLKCGWHGCSIQLSVRVRHYIPQAVIASYHSPGGNPWLEMSLISQKAGGIENTIISSLAGIQADGGDSQLKFKAKYKTNLRFFYADAIGHPATTLIGGMLPGYSCQSGATPLFPYFLSTLDTIPWRLGIAESFYPEAIVAGKREIGSQFRGTMWGNIYPRSGFVGQQDGDKAAAIVAQRVADIITRSGQTHIYVPLKGHQRAGYWPPQAVRENTGRQNHQWQRLAPKLSSDCVVFPDDGGSEATDGNYAWALWQPYSCCKRRGQKLLGSTTF